LGHVSLATTNVYADVDLEVKAKALANCEVKEEEPKKPWREDKGLMEFLRTCNDQAQQPAHAGRRIAPRGNDLRGAGLLQ